MSEARRYDNQRRDRLIQLVGERRGELARHRETRRAGKLGVPLAQAVKDRRALRHHGAEQQRRETERQQQHLEVEESGRMDFGAGRDDEPGLNREQPRTTRR